MTSEETKLRVRKMVIDALAAFRSDIEEAGAARRRAPILYVHVPSGADTIIPWSDNLGASKLQFLILHHVLKGIGATCYAFVVDMRTNETPPTMGVHVSGGASEWDMATAEVYDFTEGKLVVRQSETGDSDRPRSAALTLVPNLLRKQVVGPLTAEQTSALHGYVDAMVASFKKQMSH